MPRRAMTIAVTLCATVTAGCASATVLGSANPETDPYRHRLLGQLDLPVSTFHGWEVVETARPPEVDAGSGRERDVRPTECAPGSAVRSGLDAVVGGGSRWTGATGTGPNGQGFQASLYSGNDAPLSDVTKYMDACRRVTFTGDAGQGTWAITEFTPRDRGDFTELVGYSTATTQPQPATVATSTTIVGRSGSMTLVLTYDSPGLLNRDQVDAAWKAAADKFARTG